MPSAASGRYAGQGPRLLRHAGRSPDRPRRLRSAAEATLPETESVLTTPDSAIACEEQAAPTPAESLPFAPINNSYGMLETGVAADVTQAIKDRCTPTTPAVCVPSAHKPIPKFLDKKVRKRLLAHRRQEARAATLSGVG